MLGKRAACLGSPFLYQDVRAGWWSLILLNFLLEGKKERVDDEHIHHPY
jgi:hypothetical protein